MMKDKPTPEDVAIWQRRLAGQANNRAWSLAEEASRSAEQDEEMLGAAHAAMYFWGIVGNDNNKAHAAQLLAHVYATLGMPDHAARYLAKAQPVLLASTAEPWERALAHAIAANVAAASGNPALHREHFDKATEQVAALADAEERAILEATLRVIPIPGR